MSTKVYRAYRLLRNSSLWPFLHETRLRAEENCRAALRTLYAEVMSEVDPNSDEYKKAIELANDLGLSKDDANARLEVARRSIREGYLSQLRSSERGLYDFDVSLAIHPHAGRLYIIPYCDMLMRDVLDFLRKDKRVTDFAYWDNTDQPDNVSPRAWKEWKERGRIWEAINNNWQDMLCLDILNKSRFFALDPGLQLSQELAKAKT